MPRPDGTPSFTTGLRVAYFDRVEWHTIPNGATAAAAPRTGEVDCWEQPNVDLVPLRSQWFAADGLAAQQAVAAQLQARALQVGVYLPCGHYQPSAWRRDLAGVLRACRCSPPLFTNVRRV